MRRLFTLLLPVVLTGVALALAQRHPIQGALQDEDAAAAAIDSALATAEEEIVKPSIVGEVVFPHLQHAEALEIECAECHHETNAGPIRNVHPEVFDDLWIDCKTCHNGTQPGLLSAQKCSACHHARPSGIADETLSAKVVIHKKCWECHDSGMGVEATKGCATCHTGPRLGEVEPESEDDLEP